MRVEPDILVDLRELKQQLSTVLDDQVILAVFDRAGSQIEQLRECCQYVFGFVPDDDIDRDDSVRRYPWLTTTGKPLDGQVRCSECGESVYRHWMIDDEPWCGDCMADEIKGLRKLEPKPVDEEVARLNKLFDKAAIMLLQAEEYFKDISEAWAKDGGTMREGVEVWLSRFEDA